MWHPDPAQRPSAQEVNEAFDEPLLRGAVREKQRAWLERRSRGGGPPGDRNSCGSSTSSRDRDSGGGGGDRNSEIRLQTSDRSYIDSSDKKRTSSTHSQPLLESRLLAQPDEEYLMMISATNS